jgi:hypothetical protein
MLPILILRSHYRISIPEEEHPPYTLFVFLEGVIVNYHTPLDKSTSRKTAIILPDFSGTDFDQTSSAYGFR